LPLYAEDPAILVLERRLLTVQASAACGTITGVPTTREHATLRIWPREGGSGTAANVTATLGLSATKSHEAGQPRSERDSRPWATSMWQLHSELPWTEPLSQHLAQLCEAVEHSREALHRLAEEGYAMDVFCFVDVENGQGGVLISPEVLRRLGDLRLELALDIYADSDEAQLVAAERG
jgi:hypothetical protein